MGIVSENDIYIRYDGVVRKKTLTVNEWLGSFSEMKIQLLVKNQPK